MGVKMAINLDIMYVYNKNVLFVVYQYQSGQCIKEKHKAERVEKKMNLPLGFWNLVFTDLVYSCVCLHL